MNQLDTLDFKLINKNEQAQLACEQLDNHLS